MDKNTLYWLTYANVLAMRLHPRNDPKNTPLDDHIKTAAKWARLAAQTAAIDHEIRSDQQCRLSSAQSSAAYQASPETHSAPAPQAKPTQPTKP